MGYFLVLRLLRLLGRGRGGLWSRREGEEAVVDGLEELFCVAAGEVGAAYGAGEEGVAGDQEFLVGEVEAGAALGVAGGVEDGGGEAGDRDGLVVGEVGVGWGDLGGGDAEPAGLEVHHLDQGQVELVVEDGGSGEALELLGSGDVVDVGVGDYDLLEGELVAGEGGDDAGDVVAGIDDDGLVGGFVAEDGAVALERAYYEDFVDHGIILRRGYPPSPSILRKVFEVGTLSPDLSAWKSKKSYKMGFWLQSIHKFIFMIWPTAEFSKIAVMLIRLGGFWAVVLYTFVWRIWFPVHCPIGRVLMGPRALGWETGNGNGGLFSQV